MNTPVFNIHDLVLFLGVALCAVNIVLLATVLNDGGPAAWALKCFFALIGLNQLGLFLMWSEYIQIPAGPIAQLAIILMGASGMLKGPLIWAYICALTQRPIKRRFAMIGVPFLIVITALFASGLSIEEFTWRSSGDGHVKQVLSLWLLIQLVPLIFGLMAIWRLRVLRSSLESHFASNTEDAPRWLYVLLGGFCLKWFYDLVLSALLDYPGPDISNVLGLLGNYAVFILVGMLFCYLVSDANRMIIKASTVSQKPSEPLACESQQEILDRIECLIKEKRYHLNANLNVERFANEVGASEKQVSTLINQHYQQNFFEFINEHRVNEAKRLLREKTGMSVTEVFAASGFNSKSAFQRFFKRFTGKTPTEYRRLGENS